MKIRKLSLKIFFFRVDAYTTRSYFIGPSSISVPLCNCRNAWCLHPQIQYKSVHTPFGAIWEYRPEIHPDMEKNSWVTTFIGPMLKMSILKNITYYRVYIFFDIFVRAFSTFFRTYFDEGLKKIRPRVFIIRHFL